ncbi:hypothetical protein GCM10027262_54730 [Nocardia tengchongensis]
MLSFTLLVIADTGARALCGVLNTDDEVVRCGIRSAPAGPPDHPQRYFVE